MQHRRLYLIALAIAAVIIMGFVLSVPHLREVAGPQPSADEEAASATPIVYFHDAYSKGMHTLSGKVAVADACTFASATATLEPAEGSSSPVVLLALDIPPDTGPCLDEPATTTFSASVAGPSVVIIAASINGAIASTTQY